MSVQPRFKLPQNASSSLHQRRKSSISIKARPNTSADCLFCTRKLKESYYPKMIVKALFSKFASSQNYYYTRDINDILANNRTKAVISHKDLVAYLEEDEEYLKRYYQIHENSFKMKLLVEYYKFHKDIPRLFMTPTCDVLNRYHDKKRRIEYVKIKKMLKDQEKQENRSIVSDTNIQETGNSNQDSEKKCEPRLKIPMGNVLDGIDLDKEEPARPKDQLAKMLNQGNKCEISNSYSLMDLNRKLLEITDQRSELFLDEKQAKFHDLSNFLAFLKTNKTKKKPTNLDELSEIEKETTDSGFCVINIPSKQIFKNEPEPKTEKKQKPKENIPIVTNKEIFAGMKKLDLTKLKKNEENLNINSKFDESRPLSSNRKKSQAQSNRNPIPALPLPSKTMRDEIKTQRNFNPGLTNGLYKINSERTTYEKKSKNFVEIANEAANKIINKSQSILKKDQQTINNQKTTISSFKSNHNRVNSLYSNNIKTQTQFKITNKDNTGSPVLKNPPAMATTYNNFFQTRNNLKKETPDETYNFNNNKNTNSIKQNKKISHKYTKSDPNLLLPKMMQGLTTSNNTNNNSNHGNNIIHASQGLFSIKENASEVKRKIEHSKKLSMNLKNEPEGIKKNVTQHTSSNSNLKSNPQFYTINQNNILNIYFGEEAKGMKFISNFTILFN